MDQNNYKIPPKRIIDYSPRLKPKIQPTSKAINNKESVTNGKYRSGAKIVQTRADVPPKTVSKSQNFHESRQPKTRPITETVYTAPVKVKKKHKSRRIKKLIITFFVIILFGLLATGGYIGYKKYEESREIASNTVKAEANTNSETVGSNPILDADFIVYGTKENSLFTTNKTDYVHDSSAMVIKVTAKSSYPNDKREITISQQKVASNFSSKPEGLKQIADSMGPNTSLITTNGTSYIITGNATGIIFMGSTLITIRTSASLALAEWQQIFNDLEPIQI